jgi:histidinol-phosphatase (PHP family)
MTPLLYETHCHTPLCKHAVGVPSEYAAAAGKRGLKGLIVTCHSPMPDGFSAAVRMAPEQFETYVAMVETAAAASNGVEVLLGMESDYFPGVAIGTSITRPTSGSWSRRRKPACSTASRIRTW